MIRLWALIYRLTGWYSPWARLEEYRALRRWLQEPDAVLCFAQLGVNAADVFVGCWQSEHGFYR